MKVARYYTAGTLQLPHGLIREHRRALRCFWNRSRHDCGCPHVLVSAPVGLTADLAKRRRLCVVHVMPQRFERPNIGKHRDNILVRHPSVGVPRHDLVELPCPDKSRADHLSKHALVVIRNPRRVGSDIGARHAAPGSIKNEPAGKVHSRQRLPMCVLRRVAIRASSNCHQVFPALFGSRNIGFRHGRVQSLRHVAD